MVLGKYGDNQRVTYDVDLITGLTVDRHIKSRIVFYVKASSQGVYQGVCVVHYFYSSSYSSYSWTASVSLCYAHSGVVVFHYPRRGQKDTKLCPYC